MHIDGLKMSNHYFSMLVFMTIKKYVPQKHYKCMDRYRWIIFKNSDYFGFLICFKDKTIKVFYKGACIQYFTKLNDLDDWIRDGCSKVTLFMMKETKK
ncbi:hypothetical protein [Neobacillus drentensis]|uniref:hypothetical protein n=1 Tax=Neobacillus drentensis TaxID=220684 RepID=UPI002FFFEA12